MGQSPALTAMAIAPFVPAVAGFLCVGEGWRADGFSNVELAFEDLKRQTR